MDFVEQHISNNQVTVEGHFNPVKSLQYSIYFKRHKEEVLDILKPFIDNNLDFIGSLLIYGNAGCGKRTLIRMIAQSLELHLCELDANDLIGDNPSATELKINSAFTRPLSSTPCLMVLKNIELFHYSQRQDVIRIEQNITEKLHMISTSCESWPLVLVGITNRHDLLEKSPLSSLFQYQHSMESLTQSEQHDILNLLITEVGLGYEGSIDLSPTIKSTSTMYLGDLICMISHIPTSNNEQYTNDQIIRFLKDAHEDLKKRRGESIELTGNVSKTEWQDIGGLSEVKKHIIDTIQLSIEYPQLRMSGLRRSGILLHGPPGTGKTLLAKAVATECGLNFISVKGPELINMYVGQSEENVRNLFQRAREASPSVIFFDELDSLAPNRGQSGDSGGVMDRIVSQLLTEMDGGVDKSQQVFIIGATNRLDLIDRSLLRPGRFDKILEVSIPCDKESRIQILKAQTRHLGLDDNFDYEFLESSCPPNMSGAQFYALCAGATNVAITRSIGEIEAGRASEMDADIRPTMNDFLSCLTTI
ncbi:Peroxisomal biogenesis factor 6, partial [Fragariocoptes setiger]